MMNTQESTTRYLGHDYDVYKTSFTHRSIEKSLLEATEWMKKYSKTFIDFELMIGEFMEGCYVARHCDRHKPSETHLNGSCNIGLSDSGKSWITDLSVRNIK